MKAFGIVILAFMLPGCAAMGSNPADTAVVANAAATQRLAPRTLAPGACGLFVFTADNAKRFILFSQDEHDQAHWQDGIDEIQIQRQSSDGFAHYGQSPRHVFKTPDGRTLTLNLEDGQDIGTGMRYGSGTLSLTDVEGWQTISPVLGLASCQPG